MTTRRQRTDFFHIKSRSKYLYVKLVIMLTVYRNIAIAFDNYKSLFWNLMFKITLKTY